MTEELKTILKHAAPLGAVVESVSGIRHVATTGEERDVHGDAIAAGEYHVVELRVLVPLMKSSSL